MILLFGGTSETGTTAEALADVGFEVLVSTATEIPLKTGCSPHVSRRHGRLNETEMIALIYLYAVRAIVDVSHPYAEQLHGTARLAAGKVGIPYFRYLRPDAITDEKDVIWAASHDEAAKLAFAWKQPVLLTTGSKNVEVYARESRRMETPLIVRVLDHPDSIHACVREGLLPENIIAARGPFSVKTNRNMIRKFAISVVVSKDSGTAGGLKEKLEASRLESCRMIVVVRPTEKGERFFSSISTLVRAVSQQVEDSPHV